MSDLSTISRPTPAGRLDRAGRTAWSTIGVLSLAILLAVIVPRLDLILVPIVAAMIFTALLLPPTRWLERHGLGPTVATVVVVFGTLGLLGIGAVLVAPAVNTEVGALRTSLDGGLTTIEDWLVTGPFSLSRTTVTGWGNDLRSQTEAIGAGLARSAVATTPLVLDIITGAILTIVLTFFGVKDGPATSRRIASRVGPDSHARLDSVWQSVTGYSQGLVVNGMVNATMLGCAMVIMGIPLALPIALITLLASFIPVAGGIVSGAMAALIALVAGGPTAAAVIIAVTIVIHHLEGYVVGPMVIGRRVGLHPVVMILAFLLGVIIAGIPGGFVAGPTAAAASGWFTKPTDNPYQSTALTPSGEAHSSPKEALT